MDRWACADHRHNILRGPGAISVNPWSAQVRAASGQKSSVAKMTNESSEIERTYIGRISSGL